MAYLEVSNLQVRLPKGAGFTSVVDGVSFSLGDGEIFGIVGESGSGKTMTCSALLQLLPCGADCSADKLRLGNIDLLHSPPEQIRGRSISMIFQDCGSAINPVFRVSAQLNAVLKAHTDLKASARKSKILTLLAEVGLPDPALAAHSYAHELSGGMQQRAMIAMAIATGAGLLIADEPTTALDVTVQARILALLKSLRDDLGLSLIFISHDLAVVSQLCDRVGVMLNGRIVEMGNVKDVIGSPQHEYTRALLGSSPALTPRGSSLPTLHDQLLGAGSRSD